MGSDHLRIGTIHGLKAHYNLAQWNEITNKSALQWQYSKLIFDYIAIAGRLV